nr:hypothetical protein [uncultured Roseateles sp.]
MVRKQIIDKLFDAAQRDPALRARILDNSAGREDMVRRAIQEGKKLGLHFDKGRADRWLDRNPEIARLAELSNTARPEGVGGKPPVPPPPSGH